jgi:hypothetical protein
LPLSSLREGNSTAPSQPNEPAKCPTPGAQSKGTLSVRAPPPEKADAVPDAELRSHEVIALHVAQPGDRAARFHDAVLLLQRLYSSDSHELILGHPEGWLGKGRSTMLLPPQYAWIELVIIVAFAVFVADLIGNMISFDNRFINALTTAIVSAVAFALLIYFVYGDVLLTGWGFAVMQKAP